MSITEQVIEKVKVMSPRQARKLLAYLRECEHKEEEDRLDLEAARQALAESGENVPWEKVKARSRST